MRDARGAISRLSRQPRRERRLNLPAFRRHDAERPERDDRPCRERIPICLRRRRKRRERHVVVPEIELRVRLHETRNRSDRLSNRRSFSRQIVFEPSRQPQTGLVLEDDEAKPLWSHAR